MDRKFMASGVFQFLDEVYEQRGPLFRYGNLVGKGELAFNEALIENEAGVRNALNKVRKGGHSRSSLMDW
ncbi:hypothetical protein KMI_09g14240 [Encephalitozoon hellem]|nr:hypothetical protein KMI_09g14240 [Encephalitozoon hellem]